MSVRILIGDVREQLGDVMANARLQTVADLQLERAGVNEFAQSVIEEAARLFGVRAAHLFEMKARYSDAWVMEAEAALSYTFWLTQQHAILAEHVGREIQFGPLISTCVKRRNRDPKYSELVGELVWFAQRIAMAGKAA